MTVTWLLALAIGLPGAGTQSAASADAPLPSIQQLRERGIANLKRVSEEEEHYSCHIRDEDTETDNKGKIKKTSIHDKEQFYMNGHEVDRLLAKNGKPLSPDETRKEDEWVMKEVRKYSDPEQIRKEQSEQEKQIEAAFRVLKMSNEHRVQVEGRNAIALNLAGDPKASTHNIEEKAMQAMAGTIILDEATGELIDLDMRSVRDVKIGGGLLANLHKGFWLHVHTFPQSSGPWLNEYAEGSGDARAALLFHPYFRFKENRNNCHLYTVETTTGVTAPVPSASAK